MLVLCGHVYVYVYLGSCFVGHDGLCIFRRELLAMDLEDRKDSLHDWTNA